MDITITLYSFVVFQENRENVCTFATASPKRALKYVLTQNSSVCAASIIEIEQNTRCEPPLLKL